MRIQVMMLAGPLVLALAVGAAAWWAWRRDALRAQADEVRSLTLAGRALSAASAGLLEHDRVADLGALVARTTRELGLTRCTVTVDGVGIVADSEPSRVVVSELPETWVDARGESSEDEQVTTAPTGTSAVFAVGVGGRGSARVELAAPAAGTRLEFVDQAGFGAIAVAGLGLVWVLFRWIGPQLRTLEHIRGALVDFAAGEPSAVAMQVSPRWGAAAGAWNALLSERDGMLKQLASRQAAEALAARSSGNAMIEKACDAMWTGMLIVDSDMRVSYVNGAAAVMLRATRQEMAGSPADKAIPHAPVLEALSGVLSGAARRRAGVEVQVAGEEEQSTLRFGLVRLAQDTRTCALVVVEDVTQQRLADKARDHFVAQATHELRTPLTNIRLYLETALDEGEHDPKTRGECLNVINQEARRLERMVSDMLSVAEIEAGSLKVQQGEVRLDALFEELRADFVAQARDKQITLTWDLPPKLGVLRGDRDKLVMALHNLIGNALKYTPSGGIVVVKVEEGASELVVSVQDNGIGIAPDEAEKVFQKFYRSHDKRVEKITGTGLGLALAREVIRLHGGDITVQSQINRGSTFILTVPNGLGSVASKAA